MSKLLDRAVAKNADGGWDFACPGIKGSLCGDRDTGVPFTSTGWPTKATALARGREHFDDHRLGAEIVQAQKAAIAEAVANAKDGEEVLVVVDVAQVVADSKHKPMPSLEDFRARHGLTVDDDGNAITLADLED